MNLSCEWRVFFRSGLSFLCTFPNMTPTGAGSSALCFLLLRAERDTRREQTEKQSDRIIRIRDTLQAGREAVRMQKGNFFLFRNYRFTQKITLEAMKGEMLCFYSQSTRCEESRGAVAVPDYGNCKNIFQMSSPIVLQPHLSFSCHREQLLVRLYLLRSFVRPSSTTRPGRAQSSCQ